MEILLINFAATAAGATAGAYCAYRLSERRISRGERDELLSLVIVLHSHMECFLTWLKSYGTDKDGMAIIANPLPSPVVTASQLQRLAELSPDKAIPQTVIHMFHFWRAQSQCIGMGLPSCLTPEDLQNKLEMLELGLKSLEVLYEQEKGRSHKFFSLKGEW